MKNAEIMQAIGWSLIHFVWQGAALALLLPVALACLRGSRSRYAVAVCVLMAMAIAPFVTFAVLLYGTAPLAQLPDLKHVVAAAQELAGSAPVNSGRALTTPAAAINWMAWLVLGWVSGVSMFGLRAVGGWFLLRRLRNEHVQPITGDLLETCQALQERLGVARVVRYLRSKIADAPAVVGWFRPVVVIPVSALAGLSPAQLEAIIAHELAHIRRWDCFVNLFQIATETVLFYHPAVWWVNRVIRSEREHCCDDMAVAVCGSARDYAIALTHLETYRSAPAWAMAANGGVLKSRIARLLGFPLVTRSVPAGGLAALGILCAAGTLLAGTAFTQAWDYASPIPPLPPAAPLASMAAPLPPAAPLLPAAAPPEPAMPAKPPAPPEPPVPDAFRRLRAELAGLSRRASLVVSDDENEASEQAVEGASYIGGLQAAGLKNLTVDEIIQLKIHGVTPEYVRGLQAAGLTNLHQGDYVEAKIHGVTPEFARKIHDQGFKDVTIQQLIQLKIAGVF